MDLAYLIRGYAAPFDQEAFVKDGAIETIAPGAFNLASVPEIQFGAHGGHILAKSGSPDLVLFQDAYGLGFEVRIQPDNFAVATVRAIHREKMGASVNFTNWKFTETNRDGVVHRRVTSAKIDHISILSCPAYLGTSCWLAQAEEDGVLSPGLMAIAAQWNLGHQAARTGPAASARPRASGKRGAPAALVSLMASPMFQASARNSARAVRSIGAMEGRLAASIEYRPVRRG